MEKQEIKQIRTLIVEKRNVDFENLIIHKNTFLLVILIIFLSELYVIFKISSWKWIMSFKEFFYRFFDWVPDWIKYSFIIFIITIIIFFIWFLILKLNKFLLDKKLNKKSEIKSEKNLLKIFRELIIEIDRNSNKLWRNNINDKFIIKDKDKLIDELKKEKERRKNGNFSFWNVFTIVPIPAIITIIGFYNDKKEDAFIISGITVLIILILKISNNYFSYISNDTTLEILNEIEEYLNTECDTLNEYSKKFKIIKKGWKENKNNSEVFEIEEYFEEYEAEKTEKINENNIEKLINTLKEKKECIEFEEAKNGLSKNWQKQFNNNKLKYYKVFNYDKIVERENSSGRKYAVIPKIIKVNKKEMKENILAIWNNDNWKIIETRKEFENCEELRNDIDIDSLKNIGKFNWVIFWLILLITAFSLITPLTWINSNIIDNIKEKKEYIINNPTGQKITIKINSEEITLSQHSAKKIPFSNKYDVEIKKNDKFERCPEFIIPDSEGQIINLDVNKCPLSVKVKNQNLIQYSKNHEYTLVNATDKDINVAFNGNKYRLVSNSMSKINLQDESKPYKLTEKCDLDVKYDSKGGVVNITEEGCIKSNYESYD